MNKFIAAFGGFMLLVLSCSMTETVSTGYRAVGTRFGDVTGDVMDPGLHLTNPLLSWDYYPTVDQTADFEDVEVPAADQQKATMDVSVQYNVRADAVVAMRRDTGTMSTAFDVHFIPFSRGSLRDAGRSTKRVEDFFEQATVNAYEAEALGQLQAALGPKGFNVTAVIVRDVDLPAVIATAIESKKKREQEVEQQRAELERVELEAQQKVKQAEADKQATITRAEAEKESAQLKAEAVRVAAAAEAYKIAQLQRELSSSPQYVELVKAQKWKGDVPTYVGSGAVPFINLGTAK